MSDSLADPLRVAVAAAREAGALIREEFHRPGGPRGHGSHADIDTVGLTELPNVESQANGALMRVSPLGTFGWRLPRRARVARSGRRGHHSPPSGLPGCQRRLLRGAGACDPDR